MLVHLLINRQEKSFVAVEAEACELLTATLESQRLFYENLIALEEQKQILKIELLEHNYALLIHEKEEYAKKIQTLEEEKEEMDKRKQGNPTWSKLNS